MVMNANGGTITYSIQVDASGAVVGIKNAENEMASAAESGSRTITSKIGSAVAGIGKAALGVASATTGAIAGIVATGGFSRAMDIEQAEFKLKGLGNSADDVDGIMQNALASVKGTAFGLDDAATVAASAVAAGIQPGQDLERTLKAVADASAISGRSLTDMGAIFNKVAAGGKLTGEELNQLTDSGIPILQLLGDQMGKSAEEVRDLVSAGKIGFPEFQAAIEAGMGGAALTMGQTFSGSIDNAKAALSRLGQGVMEPVMKDLTPIVGEVTGLIDDIAAGTTENIDSQVAIIGEQLQVVVQDLVSKLGPILESVVPVFIGIFDVIVETLPSLIDSLLPSILDGAVRIILAVVDALPELMMMLVNALPRIISAITQLIIGIATILTSPANLGIILNAAITLLLSVVNAIPQIITSLAEALPTIIDNLVTFLTDPANIVMILNAATQLFFALVLAVPQILGSLLGAFGNLVGNLWNGITSMFGQFAANFGNFIGNIFKGAINGVLSFIEGFINAPIDIINGFIDIINGAFGAIGVNIGKIPRVSLPRLASGGIVESTVGGSVIMAGEGGEDEWVVPESKMASLVDQIQDRIGGGGGTINIYVDGVFATSPEERRKVAEDIMDAYNQNQKRRFANA